MRFSGQPPAELVGQHLADAGFAMHASPALVAAGLDLDTCPWVLGAGHLLATPQGRWEAAHVTAGRAAMHTDSSALLVDAVRAGVGVGIVPCALADDDLVAVGPRIEPLPLPLWNLVDVPEALRRDGHGGAKGLADARVFRAELPPFGRPDGHAASSSAARTSGARSPTWPRRTPRSPTTSRRAGS